MYGRVYLYVLVKHNKNEKNLIYYRLNMSNTLYDNPRQYTKKNTQIICAIKYKGQNKYNTPPSTIHNTKSKNIYFNKMVR